MKGIDLSGQRFGRWSVVANAKYSHNRSNMWQCVCDCGTEKHVSAKSLRCGRSNSCGCLARERAAESCRIRLTTHGETAGKNSRVYRIWANMRSRCDNPKFDAYPYYGGRGIKTCEAWKVFGNFLKDMGHPPDGFSIDRIDSGGDYEPSNCKWSSKKEQANNKSSNLRLEMYSAHRRNRYEATGESD